MTPTVKDVIVRKPSEEESNACNSWPIWRSEPSTFEWTYTEKETCLVIEGKVTISDGKDSVTVASGDMAIFPKDLTCTWNVHEAVSKYYNFS